MLSPVGHLERWFSVHGANEYLGEPLTQDQHMFQTAALAKSAGATNPLIAAAMLHDVGHFQTGLTGIDLVNGIDDHHDEAGAHYLSRWFAEEVFEPVRLHVVAKRYLCAKETGYLDALSAASIDSLRIQGGPMDAGQARRFEAEPYFEDAIALRRFDDQAKDPDAAVLCFDDFRSLLESLVLAPRRA